MPVTPIHIFLVHRQMISTQKSGSTIVQ